MSRARAFTLVEVLVTIAVVAILTGIALPALQTAHRSARATTCTSNLRQMMTAALVYGGANREAMPAAVLRFQSGGSVRTVNWDFEIDASGHAKPGTLWAYSDTPLEVQQCPDFNGDSNSAGDPFTGYNYNTTYIGHEGGFPAADDQGRTLDGWSTARMGLPVPSFARPERVAVFGDGGWKNGANKFMRAPMNTVEGNLPMVCAGTQAFRHAGGCTCCAFLDGHVGMVRQAYQGSLTTPPLASLVIDFPSNGFLSEDDAAYR
jgi:prepilin-type N-terminal cleavage/methylation domain-containing protein